MSRDDSYSRLVLWLKVTLPLLALAILSTLFLVAETLDPEAAIPYAEVDVEQILLEQGVTRPEFSGVTEDGVTVSVAAEAIRPTGSEYRGTDLSVKRTLPAGGVVDVDSPEGTFDIVGEFAFLSGGVHLRSTTGYDVATEALRAGWGVATLETGGPVDAVGPAGSLNAGRMSLAPNDDGTGHVLVFKDGVRLIYRPGA